jgi:hypothetical protein
MRLFVLAVLIALAGCSSGGKPEPVATNPAGQLPGRSDYGVFLTPLSLGPPGCKAKGSCTLLSDLEFRDTKQSLVWSAAKGNTTDGASIPRIFQPFVGSPFDSAYLKAAVIHDHYCDRHVRDFLTTHRVFYNAMMAMNLDRKKALIMYAAVLIGGPKWLKVEDGQPCGPLCVRNARLASYGIRVSGDGREVFRAARYEDPAIRQTMQDVADVIAAQKIDLSPEDIDALVQKRMLGDPMMQNAGRLTVSTRDLLPRG